MIIKLTPFHFSELIKKGYDLNCIFLLKLIHEQMDISTLRLESAKIEAIYTGVIRKGLVTEAGDGLTTLGQELLIFLDTKEPKKLIKKKIDDTSFNLWYKEFPSTDTFIYKGKSFSGCRSLKQDKEACRLNFNKILLEGEYSVTDLINALIFDVTGKKEASLKSGTNKLTYMQNSKTYLHQKSFESFIELIKQGNQVVIHRELIGGTDI